MDREAVVVSASQAVQQGRHEEARRLLEPLCLDPANPIDDPVGFEALRTQARIHRNDREIEEALRYGVAALGVAERIGYTQGVAIALETLALTESEAGHVRKAGEYLLRSAQVEQARGDPEGAAFALSNYGHMLTTQQLEGAQRPLERALAIAPRDGLAFAVIADNMGSEMERQGRHGDAAHWAAQGLAAFEAADRPLDVFFCLRNLARHHRDAGDRAEGEAVFERAHELILDLRRAEVSDEHYATYPARVAQLEEQTRALVRQPDGGGWLTIGFHAMVGEEALERGMRQLEAGYYADCVASLQEAREHWTRLQAVHKLVSVDNHLAYALNEIGDRRQAARLAFVARRAARGLGDARGERMALSRLIVLRDEFPLEDPLDLIAQCRALEPAFARQADGDEAAGAYDGGVLSAQAALVCAEAGGDRLAEEYFEESIAVGRDLADRFRYRLLYRLCNYYIFLDGTGRAERAAEVLEKLREVSASLEGEDPRVEFALARATGSRAFEAHDESLETLRLLLDACRAYEVIRGRSAGAGQLGGLAEQLRPPYEAAAEVAIARGRPRLALALLERAKARTLAEALDGGLVPATCLAESDDPPPPDLGDVLGVELFVTSTGAGAFVIDGGDVAFKPIVPDDLGPLESSVNRLVDAADHERSAGPGPKPLGDVLAEPAFVALCVELARTADGRPTWIAPHRFLHQAPLELCASLSEEGRPVRWSIVPALGVASMLPPRRGSGTGLAVAVGGDPTGNLPFARIEARLLAGAGAPPAVGGGCNAEWLHAAAADPDLGVLHLACHGRFDRHRPERSGLLLAGDPETAPPDTAPQRLVGADEIASLHLSGVVVVLSACSSGLEVISAGDEAAGLSSAFLRAGATAVVAARWPIDDLAAMLMMLTFHGRLRSGSPDLHDALTAAAADLRRLSATGVCERGFALADEVIARGGPTGEAVGLAAECVKRAATALGDGSTESLVADVVAGGGNALAGLRSLRPHDDELSRAARPFGDPRSWGAFSIIGRGH